MIQSFLIIGNTQSSREETIKLLASLKSVYALNSPDITIVQPTKNTTTIEQVRQVRGHINQRPVSLPYKYVIFQDAHTLNKEAQNALLKTLEEPPASAVIILEATDKSMFLPTILSRVAIIWSQKPSDTISSKPFVEIGTEALLGEIGSIDNPKDWLDQQMISLSKKLENGLSGKAEQNFAQITEAIENCKEAKKMIEASVNPKFVLANLVLNSN